MSKVYTQAVTSYLLEPSICGVRREGIEGKAEHLGDRASLSAEKAASSLHPGNSKRGKRESPNMGKVN